jgi:predicted nucleic acid-binding protein
MKVMIDTNIFISAALTPNGNAAKAFVKAMLPPYEPIVKKKEQFSRLTASVCLER